MKNSLLLGTVIILTLISCESLFNDSSDQILFKTDSGLEYKYSDFQLYDSSTHIFYFKSNHPEFNTENSLTFSLLVNGEEIFQGVFWGIVSSALPYGPFIYSYSFYQDYAFKLIINLPIQEMTQDSLKPLKIKISYIQDYQLQLIQLK